MITLEHIECNAACDYAPVMMVNWEFMDNQTPESAVQVVDDLRAGKEVHSTRGPKLCTWRRPSACSPASPTTSPTRARPPAPPRWSAWRSPASQRLDGAVDRGLGSRDLAESKTEAVEQADTSAPSPRPRRKRASDRHV